MTLLRVKYVLQIWCFRIRVFPDKIRRYVWNKHLLLWWYRFWIRKDEFHKSLDMDILAMMEMNKEERKKYLLDLLKRREIAHQRGML